MQRKIGKVQSGYIHVTGGNIWYQTVKFGIGNNTPLLTLHGGPGTPHDYLEPLARIANDRQIIFYDQLGCGKSERPDNIELWQRRRFLEELDQVRTALNLTSFHLFGHSWGSMLAIDYATMKPRGLKSLILASPALSIPQWIHDTERYRNELPTKIQKILKKHEVNRTTDSDEYQHAAMKFYQRHLCRIHPWPKALQRAIAKEGATVYETMWGPSEFFVTGNLLNYDCTSQLEKINIPTLLTCGQFDEATPETTAWYQSLIPNSELAVFKQSAHMAHLEEVEQYSQTIVGFLRQAEHHQTSK